MVDPALATASRSTRSVVIGGMDPTLGYNPDAMKAAIKPCRLLELRACCAAVLALVLTTGCSRLFPDLAVRPAATHTSSAASPPTSEPPVPTPTSLPINTGDVARLLANRPALGEDVEVRGYTGYDLTGFGGADSGTGGLGCPSSAANFFADRPFPIRFSYGHLASRENNLPDSEPWLIVVTRTTAPNGSYPGPPMSLPYRGVLRGHFGDPQFASCSNADRIFYVTEVVEDEGVQAPVHFDGKHLPPDDALYTEAVGWPRYTHPELGFSVPLPPRWTVRELPGKGVELADPNHPANPVRIEVLPGETHNAGDQDLSLSMGCLAGIGSGGYLQQPHVEPGAPTPTSLDGLEISSSGAESHCLRIFFNDHGRTIRVSLDVPQGFDLPLTLPWTYTAIADNLTVTP